MHLEMFHFVLKYSGLTLKLLEMAFIAFSNSVEPFCKTKQNNAAKRLLRYRFF